MKYVIIVSIVIVIAVIVYFVIKDKNKPKNSVIYTCKDGFSTTNVSDCSSHGGSNITTTVAPSLSNGPTADAHTNATGTAPGSTPDVLSINNGELLAASGINPVAALALLFPNNKGICIDSCKNMHPFNSRKKNDCIAGC